MKIFDGSKWVLDINAHALNIHIYLCVLYPFYLKSSSSFSFFFFILSVFINPLLRVRTKHGERHIPMLLLLKDFDDYGFLLVGCHCESASSTKQKVSKNIFEKLHRIYRSLSSWLPCIFATPIPFVKIK